MSPEELAWIDAEVDAAKRRLGLRRCWRHGLGLHWKHDCWQCVIAEAARDAR